MLHCVWCKIDHVLHPWLPVDRFIQNLRLKAVRFMRFMQEEVHFARALVSVMSMLSTVSLQQSLLLFEHLTPLNLTFA